MHACYAYSLCTLTHQTCSPYSPSLGMRTLISHLLGSLHIVAVLTHYARSLTRRAHSTHTLTRLCTPLSLTLLALSHRCCAYSPANTGQVAEAIREGLNTKLAAAVHALPPYIPPHASSDLSTEELSILFAVSSTVIALGVYTVLYWLKFRHKARNGCELSRGGDEFGSFNTAHSFATCSTSRHSAEVASPPKLAEVAGRCVTD